MSCDHQFVENYLTDYLESTLAPEVARTFESKIDHCQQCHAVYENALTLQQFQTHWKEQPVPKWNRTDFVVPKRKLFEQPWIHWLSLTTSTLALMMVVFKVEVINNEQGIMLSFAGKGSEMQVAQLVDERVNQLTENQIQYIENRFDEYQLQQVAQNKELVAQVMQQNRRERRQDLNFVAANLWQQQETDQQKLNKRVDYLLDNQIQNSRYLNKVLNDSHTEQF